MRTKASYIILSGIVIIALLAIVEELIRLEGYVATLATVAVVIAVLGISYKFVVPGLAKMSEYLNKVATTGEISEPPKVDGVTEIRVLSEGLGKVVTWIKELRLNRLQARFQQAYSRYHRQFKK